MSRPRRLPVAPFALLLALLAGAIWLATDGLALPWVVVGDSMEPTLSDGDRVVVDLWSYRQREPRTGEIVLFAGPAPGEPMLLKRVATAPAAMARRVRPGLWSETTGQKWIWVLGDDDSRSADSRTFGPVPAGQVRGRAVMRYWPLFRAGPIR